MEKDEGEKRLLYKKGELIYILKFLADLGRIVNPGTTE